jgi:2-deoxy-D-gluconate 3-dehydrogenase
MFVIQGKRVLFTGGAGELGSGMVVGLLKQGARVAVVDYSDKLTEKIAEFSAYGEVYGVNVDISKAENRREAFAKVLDLLGGLDVLVNCAGIQRRYDSPNFPLDEWNLVLEINLTSYFDFAQLSAAYMLEKGIKGRIINIGSMNAYNGGVRIPAYAAAKSGVASITRSLSNELSSKGINVNAIAPGYMNTSLNSLKNDPMILSRIPKGRCGEGEDLVPALVFLASDEAEYITGIMLPVDGGFLGK